ncbi:MAG: methylmalonyl-CoA carboxyltransferase [Betaproteobacteria bacterium RIFCSPLOWO2_12_FULL_62_58]|nr:MAG: methylmalonyl-CoA carboxyltransferase [Betaproteobacteria bacterium RIFCSPLOWO2_02_FULL_62_79]OGA49276.1 MAG: methylmalonyl-CoA carboxyltransferase [Betaproteobacteria bacterium RIFCSPLOWO2_12_FULL_62_58]
MALDALLEEYEARRAKALAGGGAEKYAKRKAAGIWNARERIAYLADRGSFIESGLFGSSGVYPEQADETQTDGKLAGYGRINGRDVCLVVNDFTVKGASTSATNSKKIAHMRRTATERGMPLVVIGESTGARLPDAMGSRGMGMLLGNDITQFRRTRETPMCAAAFGPAFGSSTWLMCQSDFAVMQKGATMAVSSPRLVSMALGEKVDTEELGGWRLHAEITGLADQVADTEEQVFDAIKTFLSYLPSHHMEAPPDAPVPAGSGADMDKVFSILPDSRTQVYDMRKVIRCIVDKDTMVELKPRFGKSAVTTLARLGGKSVGVVANNPLHRGGALDADACRKIVDFLVLCDSFNVPILLLVDTPGFQIGTDAERAGAPGKIMNFMNAMTLVTVPRLSVIVRKSYGRAYVCMGGGRHSDDVAAWPTAEVSFMSPEFATKIVHGVGVGEPGFDEALAKIRQGADVWGLASVYAAQAVIRPEQTRDYLIRMLDVYKLRITRGVGQHLMRTWPTSY